MHGLSVREFVYIDFLLGFVAGTAFVLFVQRLVIPSFKKFIKFLKRNKKSLIKTFWIVLGVSIALIPLSIFIYGRIIEYVGNK
jgi:uncharacterized membrane protein